MKIPRNNKIKFFQNFDFFGNLFNFTINKETKFKTTFGAILSLITLILIIVTCFFFGKDFYYRTNPKVLSQKKVSENYTKINISSRNLTIFWRMEDEEGTEIDFSGILYPVLYYSSMEKNNQTKNLEFAMPQKNLKMKRCNETLIEGHFEKFQSPDQWYCMDFDTENLLLGENWDGNFLYYFEFTLNVCNRDKNGMRTKECSDFESLKQYFKKQIYISIYFPSIYFDFTDFENPLKIEYKIHYSHITRNLLRYDECFFNLPLINDDRGWIFNDFKDDTSISLDYCDRNYHIKYDDDYLDENSSDIIYSISIYLGKSFPYYIRSYTKFQDLAAIVGGFIKIVTLFFSFINYYFNNFERDEFLINYFFNISDEEKELKDLRLKIVSKEGILINKNLNLELNKNSYCHKEIKIKNNKKNDEFSNIILNENINKKSVKDFIKIEVQKNSKKEFSERIKKNFKDKNIKKNGNKKLIEKKEVNIDNENYSIQKINHLNTKKNQFNSILPPKIRDNYNILDKIVENGDGDFTFENKEKNQIVNSNLNNSNSNFLNNRNYQISLFNQNSVNRLSMRNKKNDNIDNNKALIDQDTVKNNQLGLDNQVTIIRNKKKSATELQKKENGIFIIIKF